MAEHAQGGPQEVELPVLARLEHLDGHLAPIPDQHADDARNIEQHGTVVGDAQRPAGGNGALELLGHPRFEYAQVDLRGLGAGPGRQFGKRKGAAHAPSAEGAILQPRLGRRRTHVLLT